MGTFFELGKSKSEKREGSAQPFDSCAQDTVGLYTPLPIGLLGHEKLLPLPLLTDSYYWSIHINKTKRKQR